MCVFLIPVHCYGRGILGGGGGSVDGDGNRWLVLPSVDVSLGHDKNHLQFWRGLLLPGIFLPFGLEVLLDGAWDLFP